LGMTREDIGLIMDVDEIPSREILRAAQICELTNNGWSTSITAQKCESPMMRLSTRMFEASPKCIHKKKFHFTAMVIGACIEGIGFSNKHPPVVRINKDTSGTPQGGRLAGYGEKLDYSEILSNDNDGYFPLYNAADFRRMATKAQIDDCVGYHLHNFFVSTEKLRFKYAYYGHPHKGVFDTPLGAINADFNLLVKCARNASDEGDFKQRYKNELDILANTSQLPALFQIENYVKTRHEEMKALVQEDEDEYGRADKFDGYNEYEEHMLTHLGRRQKYYIYSGDEGEGKWMYDGGFFFN